MKRPITLILAFTAVLLLLPGSVFGQSSTVKTASPPIVKIEISGKEPKPDGVASQLVISYSGGAGGGGAPAIAPVLVWEALPDELAQDSYFSACGLTKGTISITSLTAPSGKKENVQGDFYNEYTSTGIPYLCWNYKLPWNYGIELGRYTLDLTDTRGTLTHTWYVGYPFCPTWFLLDSTTKNQKRMVVGLSPNESVRLNVYNFPPHPDEAPGDLIASRTLQANNDGAIDFEIMLAPSAGFTFRNYDKVITQGIDYVLTNMQDHSSDIQDDIYFPNTIGDFIQTIQTTKNISKYSTYSIQTGKLCTFSRRYNLRFFQVSPQKGDTLPRYDDFEGDRQVNAVPRGDPVELMETRIGMKTGLPTWWYRIRDEMGKEGWSSGNNMVDIAPTFVVGSVAEAIISPVSELKNVLYTAPDPNSQSLGSVNYGSHMTLLESRTTDVPNPGTNWYRAHLADGREGWLRRNDIELLPWAPNSPLANIAPAPTLAPPTATPTPLPTATPLTATKPANGKAAALPSVWKNVNYQDLDQPGTQTYTTTIAAANTYRFAFNQCNANPKILAEIVNDTTVSFYVDNEAVPNDSVLEYSENSCNKWVTALSGWQSGQTYMLEIRYTLKSTINGQKSTLLAGNYVQQLTVVVE